MLFSQRLIYLMIPAFVFGGECVHEITSVKFVGDWKDGKREGYGCTIDDNIHCGYYLKGMKNGKGKFYFHNGEIYEGNFENDTMSGNGTYNWRNGDKYIGNFFEDKPNGQGIKTYSNGDRYEGTWRYGIYYATGVYYWKNGDKYEGYFENNEESSSGTLSLINGDQYFGDFVDFKLKEYGKKIYANGERYEGEFENGNITGAGTYFWTNCNKLIGSFLNEKAHGEGTMHVNGDTYEGDFKNGEWHGNGSYKWNNGDKYEGNFENGKLSGQGVFYYKNGDICSGEIVGNFCKGTKTTAGGEKIEGEFQWKFEDENNPYEQCGSNDCLNKNNVPERKTCMGQFPWMVKFLFRSWNGELEHRCSGTIINRDWVISAANCFFSGPGGLFALGDIHVHLGFTEKDKTKFIERKVTYIETHPKYSNKGRQQGYDIALLQLDKSLTFQKNVSPICLPTDGQSFIGKNGTVAAWWIQIPVPIITNERCQEMYNNSWVEINESNICAFDERLITNDCEGDIGAPLMVENSSGKLVLAGIVNHGPVCKSYSSKPSVYASVSNMLQWINATTCN